MVFSLPILGSKEYYLLDVQGFKLEADAKRFPEEPTIVGVLYAF
jgi:hypothetical protein